MGGKLNDEFGGGLWHQTVYVLMSTICVGSVAVLCWVVSAAAFLRCSVEENYDAVNQLLRVQRVMDNLQCIIQTSF